MAADEQIVVPEIQSSPAEPSIERLLFWIPFLSFFYFYQGADQSTAARFDLMRSIIERRSLWIDGYCGYNTADIISYANHYYSVKAPGGSLFGIVQWLIFTLLLSPLAAHHETWYWALTTWLTIVFSTSLLVAIACVVMYRLILLLGGTPGRAVVCALLLPFATIMFPYATEMTGEPLAGACLLIAFYILVSQKEEHEVSRPLLAGTLAGWAVLCDFPTMLIASAFALYALLRFGINRHLIAFAAGAIGAAVILLAYNKSAYGNPFFLSYQGYKMAENTQFPEQSVGFVGLTYPRLDILNKILIDPQRGLFYCNPALLLTVPGLVFMLMRKGVRGEACVVGFAAVVMILFNASFGESIVSWGGGTATGPRQIVAAMPFMVIPLAFLPSWLNWPLAVLGLFSTTAMLMATSVEPHFPYEYGNPLRDFALQGYLRGDFAYDRDAYFGGPPIVGESTAFNLGKLVGLPGALQLWPLAVLWILGLWRLGGRDHRWGAWRSLGISAILTLFALPLVYTRVTAMKAVPHNGLFGRYYRELRPNGFPPHFERVDAQIDFPNVGSLGGLPGPSRVIWTGTLTAPRDGVYRFGLQSDDSGWLTIDGKPVITANPDAAQYTATGSIALRAGKHHIEVGEYNIFGDASIHLSWVLPGGQPEIVPSYALTPD
ncbi:MAG TPA: PA14 domain-containing protein [Candidatus Binataceae bacterium]|nr:PA14 domain-containing protein [Candidatus Binataceae bacterium]